jgi:hypothetical protein
MKKIVCIVINLYICISSMIIQASLPIYIPLQSDFGERKDSPSKPSVESPIKKFLLETKQPKSPKKKKITFNQRLLK